jgi:hypothetical protein
MSCDFLQTVAVTVRHHMSTEMKLNFINKQSKCGVCFLEHAPHEGTNCKVQVCKPQLPYSDANTAVFLNCVLVVQTHLFDVQVKPETFFEMSPI